MKTLSKGFSKGGANTSKAAPQAAAKKEWTHKPDHVGYLKESEAGNQILVVEQDITLEKGSKIILKAPQEEVESLLRNGVLNEDQAEERLSKIPEWKLAVAKVLPKQQK